MIRSILAAGAALLALVATPRLEAQLTTPPDWRWATDAPATLGQDQEVPSGGWRFVAMPPGWHVTMGPGGVLYQPAYSATGRYALEAEIYLFPGESNEGYGLFAGGRDLEGKSAYTSFVIRKDGQAAVLRYSDDGVTPLAPWHSGDGVVPHPGGTETAHNVLRVEVEPDSVHFAVNGTRVASVVRDGEFDGAFGLRAGRGVNLHISTLDFTQRLAAPPQRR